MQNELFQGCEMLEASAQQEVRRIFELRDKWSILWFAGNTTTMVVGGEGAGPPGVVSCGIFTAGLHSNERAATVDTFFKS